MNLVEQFLQTATAYGNHVNSIQSLVASDPAARSAALSNYVRGLSDATFMGFKVLLFGAHGEEQNPQRKSILESLTQEVDAARAGTQGVAQAASNTAPGVAATAPPVDSFDSDLALINKHWTKNPDVEDKRTKLVDHLIKLDEQRYQSFIENLRRMKSNQEQNVAYVKENEKNAWGTYFEDRMRYWASREKTGQQDPDYLKALREVQAGLIEIEWLIKSCEQFWPLIQKKRQAATGRAPG